MNRICAFLLCLGLCFTASPRAIGDDTVNNDSVFTIGRISLYPELEKPRLKAMNEWLRANMAGGEQMQFSEVVVSDLEEMIDLVRSGEVDLISETPFSAVELERRANAQVILRERKFGVREYYSLLVGDRAVGLEHVADLQGKVVAFEDPGSTSGFLMPLSILVDTDMKVRQVSSWDATVGDDEVGYIFAGDIESAARLLDEGKVAAIAVSDHDWRNTDQIPPIVRRRLIPLGQSMPVLRSLVLVSDLVPLNIREELVSMLDQMNDETGGWETMTAYNRVRKFDRMTPELNRKMDELRALAERMRPVLAVSSGTD